MERDYIEIVVLSPRAEVGKKQMRRLTEKEMAEYLARKKAISNDESPVNKHGDMEGLATTPSSEKSK